VEICTTFNITDVAKYAPVAEVMRERVNESPDKPGFILTAIADENPARWLR
jgi:hypothetical protein